MDDLNKCKERHIHQKNMASSKGTASGGSWRPKWSLESCSGRDDEIPSGGPSAWQACLSLMHDATILGKTHICFDFKSTELSQCQIVMTTLDLGLQSNTLEGTLVQISASSLVFLCSGVQITNICFLFANQG